MVAKMAIRRMSVLGAVLVAGCGLESLVVDGIGGNNEAPATVVRGTVTPALNGMRAQLAVGTEFVPDEFSLDGNAFEARLPSGAYSNLRLTAHQGDVALSTFVPPLAPESETDGINIDARTQAATIIVDAAFSSSGRTLQATESQTLLDAMANASASFDDDGPAKQLFEMVERIVAAGDPSDASRPSMFQIPVVTSDFEITASAINPQWIAEVPVDYDGDGTTETGTTATSKFDRKLLEALGAVEVMECVDPNNIRVVLETDFNAGRLDGNCDAINRFRWVEDEAGKSMFFVGGVHEESEIQDSAVDAMMGNTSGWVPNQVPMFDDGTNGDAVAGDNVWTISFVLPRGMRVGYKFTWGTQGALWTGSEEWPGNQHILEIVDVNGDDFVYRRDNFGDEAGNKDLVNLNRMGNGTVDWETDNNGDGIPDARERPLDSDNDCVPDGWVSPTGVGPATIPCS